MSGRSARATARPFPIQRVVLWSTIALLAVVGVVAIGIANHSVPQIATEAPPLSFVAKGDPAPDFSVATTQGAFRLSDAQRPVLVEVFATWCPHCQRETAALNRLYDTYRSRMEFVAVSGSPYARDRVSPESQADVLEFARYINVRYPIAYDPTLTAAKGYLQGGFPTIAVVGTDKKVAYIGSGEISEATLNAQIRALLGVKR